MLRFLLHQKLFLPPLVCRDLNSRPCSLGPYGDDGCCSPALRSRASITAGERGQVCQQRGSLTLTAGWLSSALFITCSSQKGLQGPHGIEFGSNFLLQISIWDCRESLRLTGCKNSYSGTLIRNLYRRTDRQGPQRLCQSLWVKIIATGSKRPCLQFRKESGTDSQKPQLMRVAIGMEHAGILLPSPGCSILFWPMSAGSWRSSVARLSARQVPDTLASGNHKP